LIKKLAFAFVSRSQQLGTHASSSQSAHRLVQMTHIRRSSIRVGM